MPFEQAYRIHSLHAQVHAHHLGVAVRSLRSCGVEPILAKGWSIASRYPEPGLRPYGDIDMCVRPDQHAAALTALGDTPTEPKNHPVLTTFGVDLHASFLDLSDRPFEELHLRARILSVGDTSVRVLSLEDHLRLICLHFLRHGAWRPLWLCDIGLFLESLPQGFDWDLCLRGRARHVEQIACALGLAGAVLGAVLPDSPVSRRAISLPRWLRSAMLEQWSKRYERYTGAPFARYLATRRGIIPALRRRWPNPIEATVSVDGPFNEAARLPFQLADSLQRGWRFAVASRTDLNRSA
ncbi:MAG: nucleotidyltransferase family protein [Gemmatimonadota bacterium]|nr:nucleotidyltransferase family protein [Gemmatimonadota bacterium]